MYAFKTRGLTKSTYLSRYFMYQPVSYKLDGRAGTREDLTNLINTCRKFGKLKKIKHRKFESMDFKLFKLLKRR